MYKNVTPSQKRLDAIPKLYETENIPIAEKNVHLHFFIAGCDWYIVEYDGEDLFFGFAILNNDLQNAEWGYISFQELKDLKLNGMFEVECEVETWFPVQKAGNIQNIIDGGGII